MYKIFSKLVDECRRYSKPKQCHFWAWLKRPIFGVHDSKGSAETLVRRGGITNYRLIAYFFQQYLCQKLPKSVDVRWSYSVQRQCRFFETQCIDCSRSSVRSNIAQYTAAEWWVSGFVAFGTARTSLGGAAGPLFDWFTMLHQFQITKLCSKMFTLLRHARTQANNLLCRDQSINQSVNGSMNQCINQSILECPKWRCYCKVH